MSSIQEDITPYLGLAAAAAGAGIGLLGNQDRATQLLGNSSTQTVERIVLRLHVGNIYGELGLMCLYNECVGVHKQPAYNYNFEPFSSLDAIGTAVTAHPYLICGTVVLCVLIGGTLYYFDRKHRRQMELMENLMRTGNFTVHQVYL